MNIRRLVAAALALLMLLSFVGCKTVDKTTDKKLPSSSGSSNEAISEEQSENTEQESSATPSDSSDNSASASEGGSTAKETQNQSGGTATTAQLKPDIKKSRNFLGTDLDGWYNWALAGKGYNEGANYIKVWAEEFDSHDNLVKRVSYKTLDGESLSLIHI